jgi:hypothetical protein
MIVPALFVVVVVGLQSITSKWGVTQRSTTNAGELPHDEEGVQCNNLLCSGYDAAQLASFFSGGFNATAESYYG